MTPTDGSLSTMEATALAALIEAFDTLQQSAIADKTRHRYNEKFQYLVLPAIVLLLVNLLIGERRRKRENE